MATELHLRRHPVRGNLRLALLAAFVGLARFAGSGEWDALLLPAWPLFFAAVAWCSIDAEA